jgi:EAL domain-containing protein (putative c-di-GMP-specific phosphodiesterase class I)
VSARLSLLDRLLAREGISVAFQPIVEFRDGVERLHSLECLVRGPAGTNAESAAVLFDYVRRRGAEVAVDRLCIAACLHSARTFPSWVRFSVNVHATTLSRDEKFVEYLLCTLRAQDIAASRLTIEIVEHAPPHDGPAFLRTIAAIREAGLQLALDDIGLGHSNYKMIVDSRPDYFKIDRYFISTAQSDPYRLAVLESVAHLASRVGARVVAEGVETREALLTVTNVGINLIQGFLVAPPLTGQAALNHRLLMPVA